MNSDVYIIRPLEHGNGGCYGMELLAIMPLTDALQIRPMEKYKIDDYGITHYPRICQSDDGNDVLFVWNNEEKLWEKNSRGKIT